MSGGRPLPRLNRATIVALFVPDMEQIEMGDNLDCVPGVHLDRQWRLRLLNRLRVKGRGWCQAEGNDGLED